MDSNKRSWGLFRRRECPVPTIRGFAVLLFIAISLAVLAARTVYPFLAVNSRVRDGVLVVEGWVPDYALEKTIAEFKRNHYSKLFVTGVPLDNGAPLSEYKTFAELGAATLIRLGFDTNTVQAVPAARVRADRTYACAAALKNWFLQNGIAETNVNVITMGAHARRTRLLFSKALGKDCRIGVISLQSRSYDPHRWWESSEGVRTVIGEGIAYGYARLLFRPPAEAE